MSRFEYTVKVCTEHKKWTEEEHRNAKPVPNVSNYTKSELVKYAHPEVVKAIQKAQSEDAPEGFVGWEGSFPEGYVPNPELNHGSKVNNPQTFPFSCIGKLSFEDINGVKYYGSAAVVYKNGIITAAHCVYDNENNCFFKNHVFRPCVTPTSNLGEFEVLSYMVPDLYKAGYVGLIQDDFAFCKLGKHPTTFKSVMETVGGILPAKFNQPINRNVTWLAVGYPGEKGGFEMWKDEGKCIPSLINQYVTKTNQHLELSHKGMSGGPWFVLGTHYINGISSKVPKDGSMGYPDTDSPYFDNQVFVLYKSFFDVE